jgi:hypothetical protein
MKKRMLAVVGGALVALFMAVPGFAAAPTDANDDGLPDRWEKRHGLSLKVDQAKRDQDRDGLRNMGEFKRGSDPREADTDGDGSEDGEDAKPCDRPEGEGGEGPGGRPPHGPPPPPAEEAPAE